MARLPRQLPVLDVLLGTGLAVASGVLQPTIGGPEPWVAFAAALWSLPLVLRTAAPLAMAVAWSLAGVAYVCFPVVDNSLGSFLTLLVVTFSAGANLAGRRLVVAVAAMVSCIYVVQLVTAQRPGGDTDVGDVFFSPVLLVVPVVGGMLLRRSRQQAAELRRLTSALDAEREAHARDAAAAERNRIARELHDVISHSVSVMVVQAGAAVGQLPDGSPARPAVEAVRSTGKEALAELRRQLGVLRDGPDASPAPLPGVDDLVRLVDQSGARLDGDLATLRGLPPGAALTVYRVVQEALTNARRHAAGAPVRVRLDRSGGRVAVDVVNGPARPGTGGAGGESGAVEPGGFGLAGMRERVSAYAGQLEAGRTDDGGWRVRALLPVPGTP